jgi:hypothetical protein
LRKLADAGLIAAFFLLLWLPTADTFLHLDPTPAANENRAPARFPEFRPGLGGAREFLTGLESYYSDHFGFRNRLVRWEQHWKWQIFRDARVAQAISGRDGWLYFSGGLMIDDVMGNRPFSEGELEAWRQLLVARRDWLAKQGIRYLFVIAPDKHSIYPEHLPEWLARSARPHRRLEQFVDWMKTRSDVPVLDLRGALLAEKARARVYLRTDTHWNDRGAFAAYRSIIASLNASGMALKPLDSAAFRASAVDLPAGDLARMLGRESSMPETGEILLESLPPLVALRPRTDTDLRKKWIPGTEPLITEHPSAAGRVVVFRDSFAIALMKFLGYNFNRAVYVWQQNWDRAIIEREKPDVVIDEMLERFVITRNPADIRAGDDDPGVQLFGER